MFFLMTVSSAPLDLVHGKQASKHVTEMMSHPHLSQALFQNKTFLTELAEADPETLNTILGLLNDLLDASEAASLAFTTDVTTALSDKDAKSDILAAAVLSETQSTTAKTAADLALEVAVSAKTQATSNFDAAVLHHTAMVAELNDKQPGVDAETQTLESTIALIETLLPEVPCTDDCVSTPGWVVARNPICTCQWMESTCGPMRRGECLEHGGDVTCQWIYLATARESPHWPQMYDGTPAANCCNCKGFKIPEDFPVGTATKPWPQNPLNWTWNGNWISAPGASAADLPVCWKGDVSTPGWTWNGNNWVSANGDTLPVFR